MCEEGAIMKIIIILAFQTNAGRLCGPSRTYAAVVNGSINYGAAGLSGR